MNGLTAVYGNHLGAQLLGLANAASAERNHRPPSPASSAPRRDWKSHPPHHQQQHHHHQQQQQQQQREDEEGEGEYEEEIIEEMSGNWPSSGGSSRVVPRVDSVEWARMEEGADDETLPLVGDNGDADSGPDGGSGSPQRSVSFKHGHKRKRSSLGHAESNSDNKGPDDKSTAPPGSELPSGKKRLSCIDCGCRAALKACAKIMCIDCCAKDGRVCDAHAKKLYEQAVRKQDPPAAGGNTEKEHSGPGASSTSNAVGGGGGGGGKEKDHSCAPSAGKPAKKRARARLPHALGEGGDGRSPVGDQDDDLFPFPSPASGAVVEKGGEGGDDDFVGGEGEVEATPGDELESGARAKRSVLYETITKQDKKIRALQNDLKDLRALLLSVVDKQTAFSRQLRHISGVHSDALVIDEDEDEDGEDDAAAESR